MAPVCVCGHRASEHRKQLGIRGYCTQRVGVWEDDSVYDEWDCGCTMYRPQCPLSRVRS